MSSPEPSPAIGATPRARVFIDVDDTLLTWNWRLRPFAREVLAELGTAGFAVYLWSGRGKRWDVVNTFGLAAHVRDCFEKPLFHHRERLAELGVPFAPDYVVDDHAEVVAAFGGLCVRPPHEPLEQDRELLRVLDDLRGRSG
ncbi:MAG TPA: HAD hydrolase family protein [Dehalococcoidia bacterium]|nr:HAD hydrolase family protein [Dehalococcoidia bacterium]